MERIVLDLSCGHLSVVSWPVTLVSKIMQGRVPTCIFFGSSTFRWHCDLDLDL